jgi:hypothetical protein
MMRESTRKKAELVHELVKKHYEPGRQDRCLTWVYRYYVWKEVPMCERAFWHYLERIKEEKKEEKEDKNQLKLDF